VQNLRLVSLAVPEILWLPKISKVGHVTRTTPLLANFSIFDLVTANPFAKFEVCIFSGSRDVRVVPKFEK